MSNFSFSVEKRGKGLARVGRITTPHGIIQTPAFVAVGTKATVKSLTPEQVQSLGAQVVLGNTYHLYLQPGDELVHEAGGLHSFMCWDGPTMTDSGGFQVFSLGAGMGRGNTKFKSASENLKSKKNNTTIIYSNVLENTRIDIGDSGIRRGGESGGESEPRLAKIDENGVTFRSHLDGSEHRFTPERSIEVQHNLGADILFAFDECTLPSAPREYQEEAMERTHAWAKRSLERHHSFQEDISAGKSPAPWQALFGIVQGGRYADLRKKSAKIIGGMPFDGFGIGGSFSKEDLGETLSMVNEILPEGKPRHLLGIGEPEDLFLGIANGCDTFDCVLPTRNARNGTLYTRRGKLAITNAAFTRDFLPIDDGCACYTCTNFTRAYLSHLFRGREMLAATLASIHNLYFIVHLVDNIRNAILDERLEKFKDDFMAQYKGK